LQVACFWTSTRGNLFLWATREFALLWRWALQEPPHSVCTRCTFFGPRVGMGRLCRVINLSDHGTLPWPRDDAASPGSGFMVALPSMVTVPVGTGALSSCLSVSGLAFSDHHISHAHPPPPGTGTLHPLILSPIALRSLSCGRAHAVMVNHSGHAQPGVRRREHWCSAGVRGSTARRGSGRIWMCMSRRRLVFWGKGFGYGL
jgi:hypothetical protein